MNDFFVVDTLAHWKFLCIVCKFAHDGTNKGISHVHINSVCLCDHWHIVISISFPSQMP